MSEAQGSSVSGTTTTSQGAAGTPPSASSTTRTQSATDGSNPTRVKSGTRRPSEGPHASGSLPAVSGSKGTGDREDNAPQVPDLPDEFDLDAVDEQTLQKLQRWKKKVKVNGKEKDASLADLIRYAQKEMSADERMMRASEIEKRYDTMVNLLKTNPIGLLEKIGLNVDDLAKQRVLERYQYEQMSPEQRQALEAKREAEEYKERFLQMEKERLQKIEADNTEKRVQHWQKSIVTALQKSGLPPEPLVASLTANFVRAQRKAGFKDTQAEDVIPQVQDFCVQMARYFMKSVPTSQLFKALGDDFETNIRKYLLESVQNPIRPGFRQTPEGVPSDSKEARGRRAMTADEYREHLNNRFG